MKKILTSEQKILNDLEKDYESCKKSIIFYDRISNKFEEFKDVYTKKELKDQLDYYREMLVFLKRDIEDIKKIIEEERK